MKEYENNNEHMLKIEEEEEVIDWSRYRNNYCEFIPKDRPKFIKLSKKLAFELENSTESENYQTWKKTHKWQYDLYRESYIQMSTDGTKVDDVVTVMKKGNHNYKLIAKENDPDIIRLDTLSGYLSRDLALYEFPELLEKWGFRPLSKQKMKPPKICTLEEYKGFKPDTLAKKIKPLKYYASLYRKQLDMAISVYNGREITKE